MLGSLCRPAAAPDGPVCRARTVSAFPRRRLGSAPRGPSRRIAPSVRPVPVKFEGRGKRQIFARRPRGPGENQGAPSGKQIRKLPKTIQYLCIERLVCRSSLSPLGQTVRRFHGPPAHTTNLGSEEPTSGAKRPGNPLLSGIGLLRPLHLNSPAVCVRSPRGATECARPPRWRTTRRPQQGGRQGCRRPAARPRRPRRAPRARCRARRRSWSCARTTPRAGSGASA